MPEYPDNFEMKPGDTATIELKYNEPKTGVIKSGHNEGNAWILYQVQVNNDGEWRGWFTSPGSTAYDAHKMIKKRGYKPGLSLDIELTSDSKWVIRGETWDDIFGEPKEKPLSPENQATLEKHLEQGAPKTPLEELEARMVIFSQAVNERLKSLEQKIESFEKHLRNEGVPF